MPTAPPPTLAAWLRTRDGRRVLGLFSHEATFNEADEATLAAQGLTPFQPQAPAVAALGR